MKLKIKEEKYCYCVYLTHENQSCILSFSKEALKEDKKFTLNSWKQCVIRRMKRMRQSKDYLKELKWKQ